MLERSGKTMKNKIISNILLVAAIIMTICPHINKTNKKINIDLNYSFEDFQTSLEDLNDTISLVLLSDSRDNVMLKKNINLLNQNFTQFYYINSRNNNKLIYEYIIKLFFHINDTFDEIIKDGRIDNNEKDYLKTLFLYDEKLLDISKLITGRNIFPSDFKKKWIVEFSEEADKLLEEDNYYILLRYYKNHEKKYSNINEIKIENPEAKKIYDNFIKIMKQKENVVFLTKEKAVLMDNQANLNSDIDYYAVNYDKENNTISIHGLLSPRNSKKTEVEIDKIQKSIAGQINIFNYEMLSRNAYEYRIIYKYIKKVNGIYDETNVFRIILRKDGKLEDLSLCSTQNFGELTKPKLSPDNIISKLNLNYPIEKYTLTRNKDGYLEYEFHIKINDVMYSLIVDGESGREKWFGRKEQAHF